MTYGLPLARLTAAAIGTAPSSTPAIRLAPRTYGAIAFAIVRWRSGRAIALLISTEYDEVLPDARVNVPNCRAPHALSAETMAVRSSAPVLPFLADPKS